MDKGVRRKIEKLKQKKRLKLYKHPEELPDTFIHKLKNHGGESNGPVSLIKYKKPKYKQFNDEEE